MRFNHEPHGVGALTRRPVGGTRITMARHRPIRWISAQAATGVKDLPRNGAWVLSRIVGAPNDGASPGGAATDTVRKVTAAVIDTMPGSRDSVEVRLKRAHAAVEQAKHAEQEALAEARAADARAEEAKAVAERNRQHQREAAREGKQQVDKRVQELRRDMEEQIAREREQANQEVADRLAKLSAELQAETDRARDEAAAAAESAQQRIAEAHEQMAAARTLAAEATQAAQEAADQARQQLRALAERAEEHAGSAERVLEDARQTEELLAGEAARAVQAEGEYEVPERLAEHTKAELIDIAAPLQIQGAARMTKDQLVRSIRRASRAAVRN